MKTLSLKTSLVIRGGSCSDAVSDYLEDPSWENFLDVLSECTF